MFLLQCAFLVNPKGDIKHGARKGWGSNADTPKKVGVKKKGQVAQIGSMKCKKKNREARARLDKGFFTGEMWRALIQGGGGGLEKGGTKKMTG